MYAFVNGYERMQTLLCILYLQIPRFQSFYQAEKEGLSETVKNLQVENTRYAITVLYNLNTIEYTAPDDSEVGSIVKN